MVKKTNSVKRKSTSVKRKSTSVKRKSTSTKKVPKKGFNYKNSAKALAAYLAGSAIGYTVVKGALKYQELKDKNKEDPDPMDVRIRVLGERKF
jgi:hypothetical protein